MDPDGMYVVFYSPMDYQLLYCPDVSSQDRLPQLPRGWYYTICHYLEAWFDGNEGLDAGVGYHTGVCVINEKTSRACQNESLARLGI